MLITEFEFKNALGIITSYKLQLKQNLNNNAIRSSRKINIQKDIIASTFKTLQNYYWNEYNIELKEEDLSAMDVGLLAAINYKRIDAYRGFGKVRMHNFKKLMISHSVIDQEEL